MTDRGPPRYIHPIPEPPRGLGPRDRMQIDASVDWWYDTDTWFGRANALLALLGALGGLGRAVELVG